MGLGSGDRKNQNEWKGDNHKKQKEQCINQCVQLKRKCWWKGKEIFCKWREYKFASCVSLDRQFWNTDQKLELLFKKIVDNFVSKIYNTVCSYHFDNKTATWNTNRPVRAFFQEHNNFCFIEIIPNYSFPLYIINL